MSGPEYEINKARKRRLLIVDDEEGILRLLKNHFTAQGYDVDLCTCGEAALTRARLTRPDLILLDVRMPGMDGYETCARMRQMEGLAEVPILIIAGIDDIEVKRRSAESGADDFIAKPFHFEELGIRVRSLLRIKDLFDREHERARKLREMNLHKDRILSMAAHDLRNPLAGIKAHAELAASRCDTTADVKEYLDDILTSSRHMTDLLQDISDMTVIESGKLDLRLEPVSLVSAINECLRILNGQARDRAFLFDIEEADVIADRRRLRQILLNLLSNALKFSPADKPVTVRVRRREEYVEIGVRDEGVGIPLELQQDLFTPFYRAKRAATRDIPGTGLGLFIIRHLVEKHGGAVFFETEPGKGSEFSFTLPMPSRERLAAEEGTGARA
jgi:signal transduction histidine kinase